MAEKNNGISWKSMIIVAIFCVMAAFGGGISVQNVLHNYGGWVSVGYGVVGGIFTAISAVILMQVLSSLKQR